MDKKYTHRDPKNSRHLPKVNLPEPKQLANGINGKQMASPCRNFQPTHQQTPAPTGISYQQMEPNLGNQPENDISNKHNGHNTLGQLKWKTTAAIYIQLIDY
jgi:hypothetical protein